ncbi:hypothetical protein JT214_08175, partial [Helicobacter pylori]|nr:hypothetical protein [Helicobacter pylori]
IISMKWLAISCCLSVQIGTIRQCGLSAESLECLLTSPCHSYFFVGVFQATSSANDFAHIFVLSVF